MVSQEKLCYHCGNPANEELNDVYCEYGFGILHCDDCVTECGECGKFFCEELQETEDGIKLCGECFNELLRIKAAKKTATTGNHKDLQEYLRLRRQ